MRQVKIILVILFNLCVFSFAHSQTQWEWVHPYPQGLAYFDIFHKNNMLYLSGHNTLIKSNDLGKTWVNHQFNINKGDNYNSVFFLNEQTGWLAGSMILKTTNAGITWTLQDSTELTQYYNYYKNDVVFFDENSGWCMNGLRKTTDGGNTWITTTLNTNSINRILQHMQFFDFNNGLVFSKESGENYIYKTSNAGINWQRYDLHGFMYTIRCVNFINSTTGFFSNHTDTLYKTTNGGINWSAMKMNTNSNFDLLQFINQNTGYAYNYKRDTILKTTNGGLSWIKKIAPGYPNEDINKFYFINENTGFLINGPNLFKTINGIVTWDTISKNDLSYRIEELDFITEKYGWLRAPDLFAYRTANGGRNFNKIWDSFNNPELGQLNDIDVIDSINCYLLTSKTLYKTVNAGLNWNIIYNSPDTTQFKLIKASLNKIIIISNNKIFLSENSGNNWQLNTVPFSNQEIKDLCLINNNVYVVTKNNSSFTSSVYKSSNFGINWQMIYNNSSLKKIEFLNEHTGFLGGDAGLFKTTNAGVNWTNISQQIEIGSNYLGSFKFLNESTGWLTLLYHDYVYKTTNSGNNWQQIFLGLGSYKEVDFINENTGWVCSYLSNNILKTTNAGPIFINNNKEEVPESFVLSQNYPNPFNSETIINFSLPFNSYVTLEIYDITGRKIDVLANGIFAMGSYNLAFNAAKLSSGIYFYRLKHNAGFITKKLLLLK